MKVQIEVIKLKFIKKTGESNLEKNIKKEKKFDFLLKIKIYILGGVPIISLKIDNDKIKKVEKYEKIDKIIKKIVEKMNIFEIDFIENFNVFDKKFYGNINEIIKKFDIHVKKLDMQINVGVNDVITTALIIPIISTSIAILFQNLTINKKESKYEVKPLYNLNNTRSKLDIYLKCILNFKIFTKKIPKKLLTFNRTWIRMSLYNLKHKKV